MFFRVFSYLISLFFPFISVLVFFFRVCTFLNKRFSNPSLSYRRKTGVFSSSFRRPSVKAVRVDAGHVLTSVVLSSENSCFSFMIFERELENLVGIPEQELLRRALKKIFSKLFASTKKHNGLRTRCP